MVAFVLLLGLSQAGIAWTVELPGEAGAQEDWTRTTKAALDGDPEAAYRLGRSFADKTGARSTQRAFDWLGQAADAGHADAMFHLSRLHARVAREKLERGGSVGEVIEAGKRDADEWLRKAKRLGSLEAFAWSCGTAFDREAPPALKTAARVDCYLGLRVSEEGSRSERWFRSKLEVLPSWPQFMQDLNFRARLAPYSSLIPGDEALLVTRIRPPSTGVWPEPRADLIPLVIGHTWTFESDRGEEFVERVARRHESRGSRWFEIETQARAEKLRILPRTMRLDPAGVHQAVEWSDENTTRDGMTFEAPDGQRASLFFPFPAGVGSEVVIEHGTSAVEVIRVDAERIVVQTPAGRSDCVRYSVYQLDLDSTESQPRHSMVDVAPGIGMVQLQEFHGEGHYVLTGYDLSETTPAAPD